MAEGASAVLGPEAAAEQTAEAPGRAALGIEIGSEAPAGDGGAEAAPAAARATEGEAVETPEGAEAAAPEAATEEAGAVEPSPEAAVAPAVQAVGRRARRLQPPARGGGDWQCHCRLEPPGRYPGPHGRAPGDGECGRCDHGRGSQRGPRWQRLAQPIPFRWTVTV
jgi:hypothetical protein